MKSICNHLLRVHFALTEDEKNHGTAFIDIGGGSTTIAIFGEDRFMSTAVIPVGGDHITKDLSIILKTPTEQAEKLNINMDMPFMMMHRMMNYLKCLSSVQIQKINTVKDTYRKLLVSGLEELFELVLEELYRMGVRDLPGGVVLTGGITKMEGILQLARHVLKTRVRIHTPEYIGVQ